MRSMLQNKKAFTLSEILITLGIIGIVAAMTIPTLVKTFHKHQIEIGLKRAYSILNQCVMLSIAQNGDFNEWVFPKEDTETELMQFGQTYLFPFLKIAKNCGVSSGCFTKNDTAINNSTHIIKFQTIDGMNMAFYSANIQTKINFYIDINGMTKPNVRGLDIFEFIILNNGNGKYVYPKGYERTQAEVFNSCANGGLACAKLIIDNNWKIPDNYPLKW